MRSAAKDGESIGYGRGVRRIPNNINVLVSKLASVPQNIPQAKRRDYQ
jgi:hypothetical protein